MHETGNTSEHEITQEMRRLLFVIAEYTKEGDKYGELIIKELPLKAIIFKGIIDKVFDYDYAPISQMYIESRRYLNISQEGEDDLNDLREIGLLNKIRLATKKHFYIYSYEITQKGIDYLDKIPEKDKKSVERLIFCPCGERYEVPILEIGVFLKCEKDILFINTGITEIEDVSYESKPIFISTGLTRADDAQKAELESYRTQVDGGNSKWQE